MMNEETIRSLLKTISIETLLIAKQARLKAAEGYVLNTSLVIECRLLQAEIDALKKEKL